MGKIKKYGVKAATFKTASALIGLIVSGNSLADTTIGQCTFKAVIQNGRSGQEMKEGDRSRWPVAVHMEIKASSQNSYCKPSTSLYEIKTVGSDISVGSIRMGDLHINGPQATTSGSTNLEVKDLPAGKYSFYLPRYQDQSPQSFTLTITPKSSPSPSPSPSPPPPPPPPIGGLLSTLLLLN